MEKTIAEVTKELRQECKPYIPVHMPQPTFSATLLRIEQGKAKITTIRSFFTKFGYQGDYNNWVKKQSL